MRDRFHFMREPTPVMADYWQGRVFESLGNFTGTVEAYGVALNGQLLFPVRAEVEVIVKRLEGELREGVCCSV